MLGAPLLRSPPQTRSTQTERPPHRSLLDFDRPSPRTPLPDPLPIPWISPRTPYVAHGACSWESWVFTTLVTPRCGRLFPSCTVQHTLKIFWEFRLRETSMP
eukprot:208672-Prorocentrum_minimum.AAC.2